MARPIWAFQDGPADALYGPNAVADVRRDGAAACRQLSIGPRAGPREEQGEPRRAACVGGCACAPCSRPPVVRGQPARLHLALARAVPAPLPGRRRSGSFLPIDDHRWSTPMARQWAMTTALLRTTTATRRRRPGRRRNDSGAMPRAGGSALMETRGMSFHQSAPSTGRPAAGAAGEARPLLHHGIGAQPRIGRTVGPLILIAGEEQIFSRSRKIE